MSLVCDRHSWGGVRGCNTRQGPIHTRALLNLHRGLEELVNHRTREVVIAAVGVDEHGLVYADEDDGKHQRSRRTIEGSLNLRLKHLNVLLDAGAGLRVP